MRTAPTKSEKYVKLENDFREIIMQFENAEYIPNPYLCEKPKLIFIGLEPSKSALNFKKKIEYLSSMNNFILHYCTFKYFCNSSFEYHFTDISKLAMKSTDANVPLVREEIYSKFYESLRNEISILTNDVEGNDTLLVSTATANQSYLSKNNIGNVINILHWGKFNSVHKRFKKELETNFPNVEILKYENFHSIIREFSILLMTYLEFKVDEIDERLSLILDKNYSEYQKEQFEFRFAYYSTIFSDLARKTQIH